MLQQLREEILLLTSQLDDKEKLKLFLSLAAAVESDYIDPSEMIEDYIESLRKNPFVKDDTKQERIMRVVYQDKVLLLPEATKQFYPGSTQKLMSSMIAKISPKLLDDWYFESLPLTYYLKKK